MRTLISLLSLFVCAFAAAQPPCVRYSFDAPPVYTPGGFYRTNVVADFDGDGRLDAATEEGTQFVLRFQLPNGKLSAPQMIDGPVSSVGDAVGDALPDLLGNAAVRENLGGGRFAPPVPLPAHGRNVVADFSGDGRPDLLIAHRPNQLLLTRRTPAGTLEPSIASTLGDDYSFAIVKGDFDGDGRFDIAAPATTGASVRIFRNEGDGRFTPGAVYTTTARPEVIEAADLDVDGRSDVIALVNLPSGASLLEVFYASGASAKFTAAARGFGVRLLLDHFNPDKAPDVVVSVMGATDNSLRVLMNDGRGSLHETSRVQIGQVYEIASGDLTGDGHTDLFVPRVFGQEVLRGNGTGHFASPRVLLSVTGHPHGIHDFNKDGADELVFLSASGITVLWNDGNGVYRSEKLPQTGISYVTTSSLGIAAYSFSDRLLYVLTHVDGAWKERKIWNSPQGFPTMYLVDANRDGSPEVLTIDYAYQLGNTLSVTSGKEDRSLFSLFIAGAHIRTSVEFDDMNGDGNVDLVVAFSGTQDPAWGVPQGQPQKDGFIRIFTGNGTGAFMLSGDALTNASPMRIATGDFNGDGRRDVVAATYPSEVVAIYGTATGYTAPVRVGISTGHLTFTKHDFDANGTTDLIVAAQDSFLNFRGTATGLVEEGRYSSAMSGFPSVIRLRASSAPSLLFATVSHPRIINTICTPARRRSVR